jgi:hypothetical protein
MLKTGERESIEPKLAKDIQKICWNQNLLAKLLEVHLGSEPSLYHGYSQDFSDIDLYRLDNPEGIREFSLIVDAGALKIPGGDNTVQFSSFRFTSRLAALRHYLEGKQGKFNRKIDVFRPFNIETPHRLAIFEGSRVCYYFGRNGAGKVVVSNNSEIKPVLAPVTQADVDLVDLSLGVLRSSLILLSPPRTK